ncbi:cytochrome b/b6 domain-containing protein [Arthrobacter sp. MA-N2]|uniref:cytochrome b/b6 domain-containing protein n=1 Tax=Arthrobacter sp. MA-N2 TaxID=1101188 RepID=UPI0009E0B170|nr:cytochrome b/b6 domain-containing protein [Arthrobacter sp. MA-N2]
MPPETTATVVNPAAGSAGGDPAATPAAPAGSSTPAPSTGRRAGLPRTGNAAQAEKPEVAAASPVAAEPAAPAVPVRTTTAALARDEPSPSKKLPRTIVLGVLGLLLAAAAVVLGARWFVSVDFMRDFVKTYPGATHLPAGAPIGLPAWLGWQHFLNAFFIVLIIRTGWQVRTQQRPPAMWTRNNEGFIKTKNPPKKISLTLWAHLSLDALWLLNGLVFIVVLFATGQWMRVIPTSWDVFPNAVSAALQYLSLDWPTEDGWVNYNSLQLLTYFLTIFVAAPLAAITGVRMSGAWPVRATRLNKAYPIELARAIHFPVMLYFVLFVVMHVTLVFATGALRNLNHMYATQDSASWAGFWIFFASLLVMVGAVFAARPVVLAPIAQLTGKVGR